MAAIEFRNVSKVFAHGAGSKLFSTHLREWLGRPIREPFHALRNVSFAAEQGEGLGIVGHNGAGKSTLLGLATGICIPDGGQVIVNGRLAALLELGSGFHMDLTGEENLVLNAALLGFTSRKTEKMRSEIIEFSGLEEFIDEPLRTYSSGMVMRLAFSVALHMDPDILVLDEVIAVGDQTFQAKCREKLEALQSAGKTILCVSHSADTIQQLCDRAIWLDHGRLVMEGSVERVLDAYKASM
jgi:ABC-type polysaccharide/polyol phosphate transport system ATPase subunit